MRKIGLLLLITVLFILYSNSVLAVEGQMSLTNKEILERLHTLDLSIARLEEGQKNLITRVDGLVNIILGGFGVVFAGIFALIGFVLWDRRTALAPAIRKNQELEERELRLEKALREYAQREPKLAEILRSVGIL
ncbi:MAG: hypothetical protein FD151_1598 [bacterium]|nr:MAG: hypothetical protein FD151_1598 [bacterium]